MGYYDNEMMFNNSREIHQIEEQPREENYEDDMELKIEDNNILKSNKESSTSNVLTTSNNNTSYSKPT